MEAGESPPKERKNDKSVTPRPVGKQQQQQQQQQLKTGHGTGKTQKSSKSEFRDFR